MREVEGSHCQSKKGLENVPQAKHVVGGQVFVDNEARGFVRG